MCDGRDCTPGHPDCVIPPDARLVIVSLTQELLELARSAGAVSAGVTGVLSFPEGRARLEAGIESGRAGPLGFTYDDPVTASDMRRSLPWANSLLVFGVSYIGRAAAPGRSGPVVARFATEDFYRPVHEVAATVSAHLEARGARAESIIDDSRLADRSAAIRAGVAWPGRSTMALAPGAGPWMLLGSVATDAVLDSTPPMLRDCGTCTACIPACPTGALSDGALDARRCLSTWLQTPGSIPHWIRPILGRRIYGCDDCLTACPPGHPALRASRPRELDEGFAGLLALDDDQLLERFSWWFVPRRDGRYLRRNLVVAAGNSGEPEAMEALVEQLASPSSMIRGHTAWALARGGGRRVDGLLSNALEEETAPEAREEMLLALLMLRRPGLYSELTRLDEMVSTEQGYLGLGLCGADIRSHDLPQSGLRPLVVSRTAQPDADSAALASLIRVSDREGALERIRKRARLESDGRG